MITNWTLSKHAVSRILDMALDAEEVREAILRPDYTRNSPSTKPQYDNCKVHVRGRLALAVDPKARLVITVMWYRQYQSGDTARRKTAKEDEVFFRDN